MSDTSASATLVSESHSQECSTNGLSRSTAASAAFKPSTPSSSTANRIDPPPPRGGGHAPSPPTFPRVPQRCSLTEITRPSGPVTSIDKMPRAGFGASSASWTSLLRSDTSHVASSRNTTAAWRSQSSSAGPTPTLLSTQSAVGTQSALDPSALEAHRRHDVSTQPRSGRVRSSCSVNQCTLSGGRRLRKTGATSPSGKQNHSKRFGSGGRGPPAMPPFTGARSGSLSRISAGRRAGGLVLASSRNAAQPTTTASSMIPAGTGSTRSISLRSAR
mmetsp:Transcript_11160/g.34402  ORF Transcript_11160/g.34402 Transcript_11160/m.34402 type:complete len:274 (-) Transcript_11160:203-1024(-)